MFALRSISSACRASVRASQGLSLAAALLLAASVLPASAQTTLAAGEVAVVGFTSTDPDSVSLVLLRDIEAGTVISVTDRGWTSAGALRPGEGTLVWTAKDALPAGTVVKISSAIKSPVANYGTVTSTGSFNLAGGGGDSVLVYQGSEAAPLFLYAVNNVTSGAWDSNAADSNTSALPPGLTNGSTAVALKKQNDFAYDSSKGATEGTASDLLSAISTAANWTGAGTEVTKMTVIDPDAGDTAMFTQLPSSTAGGSDASAGIALDASYMVVGDDEGNVLRVYPRGGGTAVKEWEFGSYLGIGSEELDLEAGTRIGDTLYFTGSHSNKSAGAEANNREHLFAVNVTGTGANTAFSFVGYYSQLETNLNTWDSSNAHGKGANNYGFVASSADKVPPESPAGFSIEGMAATADGQLLLGFRAPLASAQLRNRALIIPITNPTEMVGAKTAPVFGAPIELNLGGRGIRDMQRTGDGKFLILAGPPGKADDAVNTNFALFVWNGPGTTDVQQLDNVLDNLRRTTGGSFETLVSPASTDKGTTVQLLQDNGDTIWPGKGSVSKDLPFAEQQFQGNTIKLGGPVAADTIAPVLQSSSPLQNAVEVGKTAVVRLQFSETVQRGSGNISLMDGSTVVATVPMTDAQVTIDGSALSFKYSAGYQPGKTYSLVLPAGAVQDMAGNALAAEQKLTFTVSSAVAATAKVLISEVNSNADGGDFFELYNYGTTPVDLTNWGWTDSSGAVPSSFPAGTSLAAGARLVVLNETTPEAFRTAWGLDAGTAVILVAGQGLGKADAVLVYDNNGYVAAAMNYGIANLAATDGSTVAPAKNSNGTTALADSHAGAAVRNAGTTVGNGVSAVWDGKSTTEPRYTAAAVGALDGFAQPAKPANIGSPGYAQNLAPVVTTPISAVQGSGDESPLVGQSVTVRGIVTAYLPELSGFYIQSLPEDDDNNVETSEAVFVYYGNTPIAGVSADSVGQAVQLTATVAEFRGLTQLAGSILNFSVLNGGAKQALPAMVELKLPMANYANWERYEGMRVRISGSTGPLVVTDNYYLGRYGTVSLSDSEKLVQYTELNAPSVAGNTAYLETVKRSHIVLDDGSSKQNPATALGRNGEDLSASNTLRAGDSTSSIEGILDHFIDTTAGAHQTSYRVQPLQKPVFTGAARPTVADLQQAIGSPTVKVASANVLNFFTTFGATKFSNPYGDSLEGRGADNQVELTRQTDKIVSNLLGLDADVYGLMEIQNNGFDGTSALAALTQAMNAKHGSDVYDYVKGPFNAGGNKTAVAAGRDAISVAVLYRKDRVTPVGVPAVPDEAQYDAFNASYGNRVPLAQTFEKTLAGGGKDQFTVVVNHLKSKGSVNDPDIGDGQGANNQSRSRAVQQLQTWLAGNPTQAGNGKNVLMGDFNAYAKEDPISFLEGHGYQKLGVGQYSYSFQTLWGSLDHVLVSSALSSQVGKVVKWQINAEEPPVLDYNTNFKSAGQVTSFYASDAYRSSDHNPIVLGLNLEGAPVDPEPEQNFTVELPAGGAGGSVAVQWSSADACRLAEAPVAVSAASLGALPNGLSVPYGALQWTATGCAIGGNGTMSISYPAALPANAKYWKFGPTKANTTPHWYNLPSTVSGNMLTVQIVDGGDGDDDMVANGQIADPGGAGWLADVPVDPGTPGAGSAVPVPTLGLWSLLSLSGLLGLLAAGRRRLGLSR
ncbi:ExeM/NucH family extracellular endonuclease [Comamonas piscis]|uniref:ExeM/NucH family extracellular endonuclease n=1 Tax=Comamonas piscis TaxID=1562974 RepID=A0A7G5EN76_9BURK|nr:ExeM/NucH family extracellular endonuclease [Comamonas piscis]QMV75451.1 ExeM/NucH family extracellular endonuclease [Comamonas piscis]WSO33957.1 ExeM/NucH family extracellular endonuclease [Comamonas piscis]